MINVADTILTQYADSNKLKSIIYSFNEAIGVDGFIDNFYDMVWNVMTADTYGLDIWGKIVVVSRLLTVTENRIYFGFNEATSEDPVVDDPQPFNQAPFYNGEQSTSTITLSNDIYRKLILMKAASNISDCTIPNMNKLLMHMFGDSGVCYARNDGDMVMSYVFEFQLSTAERAIVQSSGALPAPAGVTVNIVQQV